MNKNTLKEVSRLWKEAMVFIPGIYMAVLFIKYFFVDSNDPLEGSDRLFAWFFLLNFTFYNLKLIYEKVFVKKSYNKLISRVLGLYVFLFPCLLLLFFILTEFSLKSVEPWMNFFSGVLLLLFLVVLIVFLMNSDKLFEYLSGKHDIDFSRISTKIVLCICLLFDVYYIFIEEISSINISLLALFHFSSKIFTKEIL